MYSETNARLGASCAWLGSTRNKARKRRTTNLMPPPTAIVIQPAFRFPDCLPTFSAALPFSAAGRSAWTDRRKASIRFTTVADEPPSGPPPASLPLRLSGGWFGGHLIHPIDFAEFIQKLWIAIVQTDDLAKPGAVPPFVFYDFAPNFDFPKQQRRGANKIQIFFPRSDRIPT